MKARMAQWRMAWLGLGGALALHVADEALAGFLPFFNGLVQGFRARHPWLPFPAFTFPIWLGGLILAIGLLFALTPLVSRGVRWMRIVSLILAVLMIGNALAHIGISIHRGILAPGVYSAPLLFVAAAALLVTAWRARTN